jgi:serine/threonine protein kinase
VPPLESSSEETREIMRSLVETTGPGEVMESGSARLAELGALGPYRVRKVLGQGAMGVVFEVEHEDTSARYALKTLLGAPGTSAYERQLRRFQSEAELCARLAHPGVLVVHSARLDSTPPYLVVDLLSGGSLGERLEEGDPLSREEVLELALDLSRALQHAHERGVLHRDLKPDNVMFTDLGRACLVDFGLALEVGRETRLTKTGAAVGTPVTMAPEQLRGLRDESPAQDVYGLAATIYWAASGEPPLGAQATNLMELMSAVLKEVATPLRRVREDLPAALSDIVMRGLAKDARERPPLSEWIQVLEGGEGGARSGGKALVASLLLLCALVGAILSSSSLGSTVPGEETPTPSTGAITVPQSWQAAARAGDHGEASRALLRSKERIADSEAELAAVVLSRSSTSAPPEGFAARLRALSEEDRGAIWALACLARPDRTREVTSPGTSARQLMDLESERSAFEATRLGPYLAGKGPAAGGELSLADFKRLAGRGRRWTAARVDQGSPVTKVLAHLVLDRLQRTLGRLGYAVSLRSGVAGDNQRASALAKALHAVLPSRAGEGRTILELYLVAESSLGDRESLLEIRARGLAIEERLLADRAGGALLGALVVRYPTDPIAGLRLGGVAIDRARKLAPTSREPQRLLSYMLARVLEIEHLRLPAKDVQGRLEEIRTFASGADGVWRKETSVALACWSLRDRNFAQVAERLRATSAGEPARRASLKTAIALLQAELMLAQAPVQAAPKVVGLLQELPGIYVEEYGLRAHAKALAGEDPSSDLAEAQRLQGLGWRRLGLPWHAFQVEEVIANRAYWPGNPALKPR